MATIKKDTLHPENESEVDIYPKTSIDQVENLQANLDALNGNIANVNGEIANISTNVENIANKVGDINKDVSTLKYNDTNQDRRIQVLENTSGTTINRVEIAENNISDIRDNITVLNTAYESYTNYTEVTNGFLLTYLSGKQIELPIKAGTNVTFSKYPGSNQIIINSTGGSVPDNIAFLDTANTFTADNTFNETIYYKSRVFFENSPINLRDSTKKLILTLTYDGFTNSNRETGDTYRYVFPNKHGTFALVEDIPISLMYGSSRLGENSVDFPFNTDKNYFFTITMTNTGESKSFIYAKGTNATYTIVINSSTSFEVKLDATGYSTRLIFTNKSNADPFVVRAEISN